MASRRRQSEPPPPLDGSATHVRSDPVYVRKAQLFRVLGHPVRIRMLELLLDGERTVGDLQAALSLDSSGTSQHLTALRQQGVLESRRAGTSVYYRIRDPRVSQLLGRREADPDLGGVRLAYAAGWVGRRARHQRTPVERPRATGLPTASGLAGRLSGSRVGTTVRRFAAQRPRSRSRGGARLPGATGSAHSVDDETRSVVPSASRSRAGS